MLFYFGEKMDAEYLEYRCAVCHGEYIVFPDEMKRLGKDAKDMVCPYCGCGIKTKVGEYDDWRECMKNRRRWRCFLKK